MSETKDGLNLRDFKFPKLDQVDIAFSTLGSDPDLLAEAKRRGFYNGHGPYNKLFSDLFYSGGKVDFLEGIPDEFRKAAWAYTRALMGSFSPKHEEKTAICSMLLSELVQPKLQPRAE